MNEKLKEDAMELLAAIIYIEETKAKNKEDLDDKEMDRLAIKLKNIVDIAEGGGPADMSFITDRTKSDLDGDVEQSKLVFAATSKHEEEKIALWRQFINSGDISEIKNLYSELLN